ncbi:MAG: response regulator [Gammaproteobacteria bacterium]|nr:response regulator [Gammaproteobacteria bacterium]
MEMRCSDNSLLKSELTEVKRLKKTLHTLASVIKNVPGCVFWKDKNSVLLGCNDNFARQVGLERAEDIVGKTDHDLPWSKEQTKQFLEDDRFVISTDQPLLELEEKQTQADGSIAYLLTSKVPMHDEDGNVSGILGIYIDVTEKKKAELALLESKKKAESANRAKTEFLANMSHDVKTPMTGVVSVADLMMHNPNWCTPEKAEMIHSCGLQVLDFFNSCLELSKLEMTEWASAQETFSLQTLLKDIYALFAPQAQTKELILNIECDLDLPQTLIGHKEGVYRVVLNLVGNALKFTQQGGVDIRAFLSERLDEESFRVGIEIKDTGIGIPQDKQGVIFEKLHRLTPSYEGKVEGSGIGLYIVDQYVKRMDGVVIVKSELGYGSTFTVMLPLKVSSSVAPTITAPVNVDDSLKHENSFTEKVQRILLVEDNPAVQMVTKNLLNDSGFEVDVAGSGAEAVAAFSPGKYGLIYMDIGLPDIDGYEVTNAIREKEQSSQAAMTPIIALTAHAAIDVQAVCGKVDMQGVISKPIKRDQIEHIWQRYGKGEPIHVDGLIVIDGIATSISTSAL